MGGSVNNKWIKYVMLVMATAVTTAIVNYPIRYYLKKYINYIEKEEN